MAEKNEVQVFLYVIEEIAGLFRTCRLEVHQGDKNIGYYRIWHSRDTDNIAYYSQKDRHGVLPPDTYKAEHGGTFMFEEIKKDLHLMGYEIADSEEPITDDMMVGEVPLPKNWPGWYADKVEEIDMKNIFKVKSHPMEDIKGPDFGVNNN